MRHWARKLASAKVRFFVAVFALTLLFSGLFVQPLLVRVFGTPLELPVQTNFAATRSDVFVTLVIGDVLFDELPPAIHNHLRDDDFDATVQWLQAQTFYVSFKDEHGVTVRDAISLVRPQEDHLVATFDWFLFADQFDPPSNDSWRDRYTGLRLNFNTTTRFYVPASTPASVLAALEEGTWPARYHLYRHRLYLVDPRV